MKVLAGAFNQEKAFSVIVKLKCSRSFICSSTARCPHLVGPPRQLVVAEHDVVEAGAAVDEDRDPLVVGLHPQLHQLPEQLLLTSRIEISSYDWLAFCIL